MFDFLFNIIALVAMVAILSFYIRQYARLPLSITGHVSAFFINTHLSAVLQITNPRFTLFECK